MAVGESNSESSSAVAVATKSKPIAIQKPSKLELNRRMEDFLGWSDKDKEYGESKRGQAVPERGKYEKVAEIKPLAYEFDEFPSYGYE